MIDRTPNCEHEAKLKCIFSGMVFDYGRGGRSGREGGREGGR